VTTTSKERVRKVRLKLDISKASINSIIIVTYEFLTMEDEQYLHCINREEDKKHPD
jgi:hypothetical protein